MHVEPSNPIVMKVMQDFLTKDLFYSEQAFDYDNVVYQISGDEETKKVTFSFKCNCAKEVFAHGGNEMLEELYEEFIVDPSEYEDGFDVSLKIDTSDFPKTTKIKKSMDEEQANKIREENEVIRTQRAEMTEKIAQRISMFKRNFLGAPIRLAMKSALSGKPCAPAMVPYRQDEKYWVFLTEGESVQVFFALNFADTIDKELARVILLEFGQTQRHIKSAPNMFYHDKDFPGQILKEFPSANQIEYSNGVMSMKLSAKTQLIKAQGIEQSLTFLIGFRQYMHFHVHAIKVQLHTSMRLKVDQIERVIVNARRDPNNVKTWKETYTGQSHEDRELKEEQKVEDVFVHKK